MSRTNLKRLETPATGHALEETRVTAALGEGRWRLGDGGAALAAVSCLVQPEVGDRVLVSRGEGEERFILHILSRAPGGAARLRVPGASEARFEQARLTLLAEERLALQSLHELELTAVGALSQSAGDQFTTISGSLVENVRHHVARAQHYALEVEALLRIHGRQALLTAEREMRVDAERISMG